MRKRIFLRIGPEYEPTAMIGRNLVTPWLDFRKVSCNDVLKATLKYEFLEMYSSGTGLKVQNVSCQ